MVEIQGMIEPVELQRKFFPSEAVFDYMGHMTPLEDLVALEALAKQAPVYDGIAKIVELGSWAGLTAHAMAKRTHSLVYCVDTWEGTYGELRDRYGVIEAFTTFCRNLRNQEIKNVIPCRGRSLEYAELFPDKSVSMVFIDANHEYEHVKADILAWWPKVIDGGIVCGHDYGIVGMEGVKQAVDELIPGVERRGRCVWATIKTWLTAWKIEVT